MLQAPPRLTCVEYRRRLTHGSRTRPLVVLAVDEAGADWEVVLKPRLPDCRDGHFEGTSLACELYCSMLARASELFVPDYAVVEVDEELPETVTDPEVRALLRRNVGPNFGCRYLEGYTSWVPGAGRGSPALSDALEDVLAFDATVINGDRQARKSNLLWNGERFALIDHSYALLAHGWDDETLATSPLFPEEHVREHCSFSAVEGQGRACTGMLGRWRGSVSAEDLDLLRSVTPPSWEARGGGLGPHPAVPRRAPRPFHRHLERPSEDTTMSKYQYVILRYVHNVSTEEFVNIGVVMWLPEERRLLHSISEKYSRLSCFFENFNGPGYRRMVRHLSSVFRAAERRPLGEVPTVAELVDQIVPKDSSCFQWSSVMTGVANNPEERLGKLFSSIVERHYVKQARQRRDEEDIYNGLIEGLRRHHLGPRVEQDVEIQGEHFAYKFKLGWQNGTRQVLEPISLDYVKGAEVVEKAHLWSGRLLDLSRADEFSMTGVVAPPHDERLQPSYARAVAILREASNVRQIIEESAFDEFVPEIERDLATTHE